MIKFGTGGWREIIADGFTKENIRLLTAGLCRLMHPKQEVQKTYEVWVTGYHPGAQVQLSRSITLDGYTIRPPKVKLLRAEGGTAKFLVTIHEGRNRQVRRMCEAAGMHCTRLRRTAEGSLSLGNLPVGKWRYLTAEEITKLK